MSNTSSLSIFLLGATGYVGGQLLISLASDFPDIPIRALARNVSGTGKIAALQALHPKLETVEGSLADGKIIEAEAKKADIVINVAAAGDMDSINAIIRGLQQRSRSYAPTPTPIYIHMSGTAVLSDGARGELLVPEKIWDDSEYDLNSLQQSKVDMAKDSCRAIAEAGSSGEIRTMIVLPGLIYGVGPGIQKTSLPQRFFLNFASQTGYAGRNVGVYVHLKDVASAVSLVLKEALDGKDIAEGKQGFYFVGSKKMISIKDFTEIIGNTLLNQGLISKPGSTPYPPSVVEQGGIFGDVVFGSNLVSISGRLAAMGWNTAHTETESIYESLPREIEVAVKEMGLTFKQV
ncbi:hypothetical protein D9757_010619 [Collybiopsis confluens]|uniref:NAD(P)-binding domain-containing protein n=1 Tax=Collybiopsis confluens TaxID=2823264 RepID=A0A8H5GST4_9AGAR|nr:hypothetical protein D9757_010619 [Collybiopsis confluens]